MKYRYSFLIFLAAIMVQGNILNTVAIFNITPNLILCLAVMFSFLYNNEYHGVVFGTLFGLLSDVLFMQYAGITALGYFITALIVMVIGRIFNSENFMNAIIVVTFATVFFNLYSYTMYFFLGSGISFVYMLKKIPVMILYNCAVSAILYQIFINKVVRFRKDRFYR